VDQAAFEGMQPFNIRPFPIAAIHDMSVPRFQTVEKVKKPLLQNSGPIDKNMTSIHELRPVWPPYMDFPLSLFVLPVRSRDSMLQFHILDQAMLVDNVLEILPYLGRLGVVLRPIRVSLPGKLI
jgi:hypothetical protein